MTAMVLSGPGGAWDAGPGKRVDRWFPLTRYRLPRVGDRIGLPPARRGED
ncbi:hypothetical protein ABZ464_41155 [Streptomyces sp. NPDC005820]